MESRTNRDEIDLVELVVKLVILVKRNFIQIIIFFSFGTGLGYLYSSLAPKVYESKMLLSSDILTETYSEILFDNLQNLIREQNYKALSDKIGLSPDEVKSISKITVESALEDKLQKESEKRFFLITTELTDQGLLYKLQDGLIQFLQKNDFVQIRVEQRINYLQQITEKIKTEIQSLENFKNSIYDGKFFQSTSGSVMFDPTEVNSKIIELNKELVDLQNNLEIVNSVQIVDGFTKFNKPIWPKKSVSLAAGATLGLFLVGLMIAFKSMRKLVRFAEEHTSQKPTI
ncbi:MAG: Wzz/FepE/Etk N-terminal domain-containing protein [Cyclobacteriaceae bacterium]